MRLDRVFEPQILPWGGEFERNKHPKSPTPMKGVAQGHYFVFLLVLTSLSMASRNISF
jgi:hypothetical protein